MTEEIDLMKLVIEVDEELIQKGAEPFQRPMSAYLMIAQRLKPGSSTILQHDPLFNALNQIYNVVKQLPDYVESRYEAKNFSRLELGRFLMNTQFISGEILRQFSERDFRADFTETPDESWNLTHRTFPKK